jgi:hypothetical protein
MFNDELGGFAISYPLAMWIYDVRLIAGTRRTRLD